MRLLPYVQIARPDHWVKNVFIVPGILVAAFFHPDICRWARTPQWLLGFLAACLTASSNYVLNEILDADKDRHHPVKKYRPIPRGKVSIPAAYAEWVLLGILGIGLGSLISLQMGICCVLLWLMGALYNVPPVRLKDRPYLDVLSESVNNPLRMAMGWYAYGLTRLPTASILLSYWMFGAFLMATKRFAEYRVIGDPARAARYRRSFGSYDEERLLLSIVFYVALFAMFSAVFMTRYRMELLLSAPLVAYAIAYYLHLGFKPDSPVQYPERLYKQRKLMAIVLVSFATCSLLLFLRLPLLERMLMPREVPPGDPAATSAWPVRQSPGRR